MATVRLEFLNVSTITWNSVQNQPLIRGLVGTPQDITVTGTATTSGSRPVVPDACYFARVTAFDAAVIVAWGDDPTAAVGSGLVIAAGRSEQIPVVPGNKLSFIDLSLPSVGGAMTVADGSDVALGAKADAAVTNPALSASLIALAKGWLTGLGQKADTAWTTGAGSVIALLKSAAGSLITLAANAAYVDASGTITAGGTAQTIAAANAARRGMFIQNNSTGDLWFATLATAVLSQPSIKIPAGQSFAASGTDCPTGAISIIGATTAQAFSGRVW